MFYKHFENIGLVIIGCMEMVDSFIYLNALDTIFVSCRLVIQDSGMHISMLVIGRSLIIILNRLG